MSIIILISICLFPSLLSVSFSFTRSVYLLSLTFIFIYLSPPSSFFQSFSSSLLFICLLSNPPTLSVFLRLCTFFLSVYLHFPSAFYLLFFRRSIRRSSRVSSSLSVYSSLLLLSLSVYLLSPPSLYLFIFSFPPLSICLYALSPLSLSVYLLSDDKL